MNVAIRGNRHPGQPAAGNEKTPRLPTAGCRRFNVLEVNPVQPHGPLCAKATTLRCEARGAHHGSQDAR